MSAEECVEISRIAIVQNGAGFARKLLKAIGVYRCITSGAEGVCDVWLKARWRKKTTPKGKVRSREMRCPLRRRLARQACLLAARC